MFEYCFFTSLNAILRPLHFLEMYWFFSDRFLNKQYFIGPVISSYLLTTKLELKKVKPHEKTKKMHLWYRKLFSNVTDKSCFKNLLQWWITKPLTCKIKKLCIIKTKWDIWICCQTRMSTLCSPTEKVREYSKNVCKFC